MIIGLFRAWRYFLLIMYDATSHGRLKPRVTFKAIFKLSSNNLCFYTHMCIYIHTLHNDFQSSALLSDFLKLIWTLDCVYIFSSSACYKIHRRI